jgi:hypothetical protein
MRKRLGMMVAVAGMLALLVSEAQPAAVVAPVDVASQAGVSEITRTFSVNPADFNNDWSGKYPDDYFFVRHNPQLGLCCLPQSTLWRNEVGGTYVDAGTGPFGRTDKHGCAWGDYNNDSRPDLACSVGYSQNSKNELWRQNPDGTFTNVAGTLGVSSNGHGRYRYVTFIDANNDGNEDLYFARFYGCSVCNDPTNPSHYPGDEWPNELRINQGPAAGYEFVNSPSYGLNQLDGSRKDASSCAQAIDFDKDGDQDLLVCGQTSLKLYRNNFPTLTFTNVTGAMGALQKSIRDAKIVDLNRDGIYELARLTGGIFKVSTRSSNAAAWGSTAYTLSLTQGESLATGDFNGDGLDDVFVVAKKGPDSRDDPDYLIIQQSPLVFGATNMGTVNGSGDDVGTIDYNRDGSADFIVSNGDMKKAGPVKLWTNEP